MMKKSTKIIGQVSVAIISIGIMLELLRIDGAAIVWASGVLIAIFGFGLSLTLNKVLIERTAVGKINSVLGYLGASLFTLGLALKVLHMPLASVLLIIGGGTLLLYFVISNSFKLEVKVP
jgi:hypothetical protein